MIIAEPGRVIGLPASMSYVTLLDCSCVNRELNCVGYDNTE